MNRKQLINTLLFTAILLGVLTGLSAFLDFCHEWAYARITCDPNDENREVKIKLLMEHQLDPEIMIFGSSVALVHYECNLIEEATGLSAFNMGLNGNFFSENYGFIREYLSYAEHAKVVVMSETYSALWRHEGLHRADYTLRWIDSDHLYNCLYEMDPMRVWQERYLPFYNLTTVQYWAIRQGLGNYFAMDAPAPINLEACNKGFFNDGRPPAIKVDPNALIHNKIEAEVVEEMKKVVAEIVASGRLAVLVMPPLYEEGAQKVVNLAAARKAFQEACQIEGAHFFDYSHDPQFVSKKEWFTDNSHLNPTGAPIFSKRFAADLKALLE